MRRRDFLGLSGAVVATVALGGASEALGAATANNVEGKWLKLNGELFAIESIEPETGIFYFENPGRRSGGVMLHQCKPRFYSPDDCQITV